MMHLRRVRRLQLTLEKLEERLQPSLGLFGDVLDEDIWGVRPRRDDTAELRLLAAAAENEPVTGGAAVVNAAPAPAAAHAAPPAPAAAAPGEAAALQAVVNADGGAAPAGKPRPRPAVVRAVRRGAAGRRRSRPRRVR